MNVKAAASGAGIGDEAIDRFIDALWIEDGSADDFQTRAAPGLRVDAATFGHDTLRDKYLRHSLKHHRDKSNGVRIDQFELGQTVCKELVAGF